MTDFLVKNKLEQIVENFKVGHMYFYQYSHSGNDIKGVVFSKQNKYLWKIPQILCSFFHISKLNISAANDW